MKSATIRTALTATVRPANSKCCYNGNDRSPLVLSLGARGNDHGHEGERIKTPDRPAKAGGWKARSGLVPEEALKSGASPALGRFAKA